MAAAVRKARNYKEKSPMFAFGHLVLPLAAVVALGLLFVGIKLFFLTPPAQTGVEIAGGQTLYASAGNTASVQSDAGAPAAAEPVVRIETTPAPKATDGTVVLAGPVSPTGVISRPQTAAKTPQKTASAAKPSGGKMEAVHGTSATSAAPVKQTPAKPTGNAAWGVQIGAFVNPDGASALLGEVKKQGYQASVSKGDAEGKTFHRVRVSAGATRSDAERLAGELEKKGYPVAVVPIR